MRTIAVIAILISLAACRQEKGDTEQRNSGENSQELRYAEGFRIRTIGTARMVEVTYPFQGATEGYRYLLVPKGHEAPPHEEGTRIIRIPVSSIVCTSTTHIPLLDYLGETDKLMGFPGTDYISSPQMRQRINEAKVTELGIDKGMNMELLAALRPELVMGYTMTSDYGQFKKVEALGIPVVLNAEYLEKHPLGRAEWIKFMALFFGKEKEADSVFRGIESNYLKTKSLVENVSHRPTVMSGIVYGDAWFLPGGQNYASRLLEDAGCQYLWGDDPSRGFLELSFESVYEKAHGADLWIGVGSFKNLAEIRAADERYTRFKPYQQKQVFTYDARHGEKGGSEFLELGYLRPDIILNDLVRIAHPDLLPEYTLYFHQKLE